MARIAGVDLPPKKRAEIGLTYIYGIGRTRSKSILYRCGISFDKKISALTEDEVSKIRAMLENEGGIEGDLRKEISMNIRRLIEMQAYRGLRHRRSLPVRGYPRAKQIRRGWRASSIYDRRWPGWHRGSWAIH